MTATLKTQEIDQFISNGFVKIEQAFNTKLAADARDSIWIDMKKDPADAATWTEPVVRLVPSEKEIFRVAANQERLRAAFDQLAGPGTWFERPNVGLFVVRFPSSTEPDDTGWHIDGSFAVAEQYFVNVFSKERALLMLFLFSDVGDNDAPTRIRVGSHLDVPPLLVSAGDTGLSFAEISGLAASASASRNVAYATGQAGDVYLCHPFLVHAAQKHLGCTPRFMAQPPLTSKIPFQIERTDNKYSPVEIAIRKGLNMS